LLVTASKTALLLQCGRPYWPGVSCDKGQPGEAAEYGTLFHAEMARILEAKEASLEALGLPGPTGHAARTWPALKQWLSGPIDWLGAPKRWIEAAFILNPSMGKTRGAELDEATHTYHGQGPLEIGGACDFAAYIPDTKHLLILDHKTGKDPGSPDESPQLLTLALMLVNVLKDKPEVIHLAFNWAPREGGAGHIVSKTVPSARVRLHRNDINAAFARIAEGTLRPGPECEYCPARFDCPTRTNALAVLDPNAEALTVLTSARVGQIHQALALYDDMARKMRGELKAYVEANGACKRPDGQTVDLVSRPFSQLSMASIRRGLPKEEAEALIDELAARGCIEHGERLELRAVKAPRKGARSQ
jgi:hypothetical protein